MYIIILWYTAAMPKQLRVGTYSATAKDGRFEFFISVGRNGAKKTQPYEKYFTRPSDSGQDGSDDAFSMRVHFIIVT